jgi:hypothetical protein
MRFETFTMSDDPCERVGVCTPDGTSLLDIAQVSEDAGRPRWGGYSQPDRRRGRRASGLAPHPRIGQLGARPASGQGSASRADPPPPEEHLLRRAQLL